jgi:hypothetical protein
LKQQDKIYCDISKYYIAPSKKNDVYDIVVNKHYAGRWTGASLIFGIYEKSNSIHKFFETNIDRLVGCIIYGSSVARHGVKSISDSLDNKEVLELKRLWIEDGIGTNIESYVISQSIKYIKKNNTEVKVLISYSDPCESHKGMIYRATNWYYQGNEVSHSGTMYQYRFSSNDQWLSPRAMNNKIGKCGLKDVLEVYPNIEYKPIDRKHRYLYFTCSKKEKKLLISKLKHPIISYEAGK